MEEEKCVCDMFFPSQEKSIIVKWQEYNPMFDEDFGDYGFMLMEKFLKLLTDYKDDIVLRCTDSTWFYISALKRHDEIYKKFAENSFELHKTKRKRNPLIEECPRCKKKLKIEEKEEEEEKRKKKRKRKKQPKKEIDKIYEEARFKSKRIFFEFF